MPSSATSSVPTMNADSGDARKRMRSQSLVSALAVHRMITVEGREDN